MSKEKACRDINELLPVAQTACKLFLDECKKQGLDIFITETYRSQERQDYLYEQGRTRPGQVVTWTLNSNHKGRLAWDVACNGKNLYDSATLKKAGLIAMGLGIGWGGVWKKPDMPHFEVTRGWVQPEPDKEDEDEMLKEKFEPIKRKDLQPKHLELLKRLEQVGMISSTYEPSQMDLHYFSLFDAQNRKLGLYK